MERQPARQVRSARALRSIALAHAARPPRGAAGSFTDRAFVRSVHGLRLSCLRSLRTQDRSGEDPMKRALIGGIGNVLLGDDGIGPYVVHVLESRYTFGESVAVADLGTPALDLTHQ